MFTYHLLTMWIQIRIMYNGYIYVTDDIESLNAYYIYAMIYLELTCNVILTNLMRWCI